MALPLREEDAHAILAMPDTMQAVERPFIALVQDKSRLLRRMSLLLPLLIILAACAPNVGIFAASNWQAGGLQADHIRALAVDPNNPQNIYAGDTQHGVFV